MAEKPMKGFAVLEGRLPTEDDLDAGLKSAADTLKLVAKREGFRLPSIFDELRMIN